VSRIVVLTVGRPNVKKWHDGDPVVLGLLG
jgi:hypothetical protein